MAKATEVIESEINEEIEAVEDSAEKEFSITINISNQNLSYKSDFQESETIFWLEAVKSIILKNAFDRVESVW